MPDQGERQISEAWLVTLVNLEGEEQFGPEE